MKVYQSKNAANIASILFVLSGIISLVIALVYFRPYWHFLFVFSTMFLIAALVLPEILSSFYSIKNGYLLKQMDKKNMNDPWKTYTIDANGKRDYKATIFSIKLSEIIKIEQHKNLFGTPFIAIYYNENNAIDIYLKPKEMEEFINEISEKRDPSV